MEGMDKMTDLERLTSNIWSSRDFGGWDPDDGFEGVLDALPLRYFRCREILSPHRKQIARELGYGERFDVPEAMWRNGITILLIADKIRHAVGHPVQMRNFYRPADYNKAVGGSENSDHIEAGRPGFCDSSGSHGRPGLCQGARGCLSVVGMGPWHRHEVAPCGHRANEGVWEDLVLRLFPLK